MRVRPRPGSGEHESKQLGASRAFGAEEIEQSPLKTMAADIAREIIEQSKGGDKLAFSFSIIGSGRKFLFLTVSKDVTKNKMIYHIHKPCAPSKTIILTYDDEDSTYNVIKSILRANTSSSYVGIELVLYKNSSNIIEVTPLASGGKRIDDIPAFLEENVKLLDTVGITEE